MGDEMTRAKEIDEAVRAADAKKRADAEEAAMAGDKLDRILDCMDALGKRMDSIEAERAAKNESEGEGEIEEKGKPKELAADSRKDSRIVRKDSAADAEEIAHFKRENNVEHMVSADSVLAAIQTDADRAATAWGKSAAQPWDGETITAYRRRTANDHKVHSAVWKTVDLHELSGQALRNATAQIFADSIAASSSNATYSGDILRVVNRRNPDTGHMVKEYYGSPMAWMSQFTGNRQRARFDMEAIQARRNRLG